MEQRYKLSNGVEVPMIALGTALNDNQDQVAKSVVEAVEVGYRSIDTAAAYNNQIGIGKGIRSCGIKREELYITSKVWNNNHGLIKTQNDFNHTLEELGLDYIDQFLIHWPGQTESFIDTWHALEKLYVEKKVRVIGVSNFLVHHLTRLLEVCEIKPMVNQLEINPVFIPNDVIEFCNLNHIQVEAYRPICWGMLDHFEILQKLSKKYNKTPTQIVIRWHLEKGIRPLPKTIHRNRMIENLDVFDFKLEKDEIIGIDKLDTGVRQTGQDPDTFFMLEMPIITE
jgi:diketogulonate reductase-like aldo/keto reductase